MSLGIKYFEEQATSGSIKSYAEDIFVQVPSQRSDILRFHEKKKAAARSAKLSTKLGEIVYFLGRQRASSSVLRPQTSLTL